MVGTILPVVYGAELKHERSRVDLIHLMGSVGGGAIVGLVIGALGSLVHVSGSFVSVLVASIALAYSLRSLGYLPVPTPQFRRQVPASWRVDMTPNAMALAYGAALGSGVLTHVWANVAYPVMVWIGISGGPILGAVVWAGFGFGRAIPIVAIRHATSTIHGAFAVSTRLEAWSQVVRLVDGLVLAVLGGYFIGQLLGTSP